MKTKIIPFDLETAKKIQAGEIEGRIILEFNSCPVRIICLDKKSDTNKVVGLIEKDGIEYLAMYSENGVCTYIHKLNSCYRNRLLIELQEEAPEHKFKPFDKVLVRNKDDEGWQSRLYDMYLIGLGHAVQDNFCYVQCIPYAGNENLVGTTDSPE